MSPAGMDGLVLADLAAEHAALKTGRVIRSWRALKLGRAADFIENKACGPVQFLQQVWQRVHHVRPEHIEIVVIPVPVEAATRNVGLRLVRRYRSKHAYLHRAARGDAETLHVGTRVHRLLSRRRE